MAPRNRDWLSAAIIAKTAEEGELQRVELQLLSANMMARTVSIRFLDRNRFELCGSCFVPNHRYEQTARLVSMTEPTSKLTGRVADVLGCDSFYRRVCTWRIPRSILQAADFIRIDVSKPAHQLSAGHGVAHTVRESTQDSLCLEIPRTKFLFDDRITGSLYFLMTHQQRNDRFMSIAETCDLLTRTDEATTEAMEMVMFTLLSGIDCPLVTEPLEDESDE